MATLSFGVITRYTTVVSLCPQKSPSLVIFLSLCRFHFSFMHFRDIIRFSTVVYVYPLCVFYVHFIHSMATSTMQKISRNFIFASLWGHHFHGLLYKCVYTCYGIFSQAFYLFLDLFLCHDYCLYFSRFLMLLCFVPSVVSLGSSIWDSGCSIFALLIKSASHIS